MTNPPSSPRTLYYVSVDGETAPRVAHRSIERAQCEAYRLSALKKKPARILAQVGAVFPLRRGGVVCLDFTGPERREIYRS